MPIELQALRATEARADDGAVIELSLLRPEAFAELYDRHAGSLYRYAARRLGERLAEDVVAETFLAAFRRRDSYELARADARPWLYGIAANVIGKHRRSELRMLRAFARAGVDPIADGESDGDGDGVDTRLAAGAVRAELAAALAALPRRDREVLLLVAWAELTYDEVAVALSIPVGTVRSRLNRARAGVRAALGPGFHDEGDHR